ncbi:MAG: LysM peptidoglycan-binding domain-containing protein [Clostridia bacterium]|nr:LysM peptidoglycan-binding domain-containing protein [Clostridia bacterium]
MIIHNVKSGETLTDVAACYGISPIKLAENNGLSQKSALIEGEELLILQPTRSTNAKVGESLDDIARRFGVRESTLLGINPELCGSGRLYAGQPIAVKYGQPLYGLGIGNGYYYRGCSREALMRALPYLNYVTVSGAVGRGGRVNMLFDDTEVVSLARAAGKLPMLRLWLGDEDASHREATIKSALLIASARGYHGLTLAGEVGTGEESKATLSMAKEASAECGLSLFGECDVSRVRDGVDIPDVTVLTYDKIHFEKIPGFDEGERVEFTRFAERHDAVRAFIDLSPFALISGKYITKDEARYAVLRGGGSIHESGCESYAVASVGKGRRERLYIWETMKNTRKKLELLSELGYYGISFDIARAPIYDLLMFRVMFSDGIGMRGDVSP